MLRRILSFCLCLSFCWMTTACGSSASNYSGTSQSNPRVVTNQIASGEYAVQQAEYNDANGEYTLMLLNTPAGVPPTYQTTDLQMAQLTDEEVKAGKRSYLSVNAGKAVLHIAQDFRIEYVHNVAETQTDPQTGQTQTVIVRRESSFWTPFAGAVAGQIVGNMLFAPRYYVPPVYQPGIIMTGYGGYGSSYSQAVDSYRTRYKAPPAAVKNREVFRTTGNLRTPSRSTYSSPSRSTYSSPSTGTSSSPSRTQVNTNRSSGSGYGSSNLRTGSKSRPTYQKRSTGFGSGRSSRSYSRPRRR